MNTVFSCPNCLAVHDLANVLPAHRDCFLLLLAETVADRGTRSLESIACACVDVDADALWDEFGGPAVDWLEDRCVDASPMADVLRYNVGNLADHEVTALAARVREALEGDSNDAEHDALADVAETLGMPYRAQ